MHYKCKYVKYDGCGFKSTNLKNITKGKKQDRTDILCELCLILCYRPCHTQKRVALEYYFKEFHK